MYNNYFRVDDNDRAFYDEYLKEQLPDVIIDAHMHINLPEHVKDVDEELIRRDWALQYGMVLPQPEAADIVAQMFPGKQYRMLGFPWPLMEADIAANNAYLSGLAEEGKLSALMCVRPQWSAEYCEQMLLEGGFAGFKPYPYMVSPVKDDEISIYDCIPKEQLRILQKHKKTLLLHIPRKRRLADDDNIREIRDIVQTYPDITIVLAHFGRSFSLSQFEAGIKKLGDDRRALFYDTAGVQDLELYRAAFDTLGADSILYGTDMPIFLWHGRIDWKDSKAVIYCREDFEWNPHIEGPDKEKAYTFFMYEQIRNTLSAMQAMGAGKKDVDNVFFGNAARAYGL